MPEKGKRKFTRIQYVPIGSFGLFFKSYNSCRIINLNLTGMFVVGHCQQHAGEHCFVNLDQKGISSDIEFKAFAKIVRTNSEGLAFEFTSMSFDSYIFLQMTLLYEAEHPVAIGLELADNCPFEIIEQQPAAFTETTHFNYQNILHTWPQTLPPEVNPVLNKDRSRSEPLKPAPFFKQP